MLLGESGQVKRLIFRIFHVTCIFLDVIDFRSGVNHIFLCDTDMCNVLAYAGFIFFRSNTPLAIVIKRKFVINAKQGKYFKKNS